MFKDYYNILGVDRSASHPEIKKSYRKLAKIHHPDSNPNPDQHARFLLINEAYQVLSDAESRKSYNARYDQIFRIRKARKKKEAAKVVTEVYKQKANPEPSQPIYDTPEPEPEVEPSPEVEPEVETDYSYSYQEPYQQAYDFTETFQSYPPPGNKNKSYQRATQNRKTESIEVSKLTFWLAKGFSVLCLLFAFSIITDYFLAEASEVQVMLEAKLITGPDEKLNCLIKTDKSEFPIDYSKYGFLGKGDRIRTYTTPIYKVMNSVEIVEVGESIFPHYGIYNAFSIFILALLICTSVAILSQNPGLVLRLGIANVVLVILTALILYQS
ncbi:MAG: DnaJ domain-containing protein [Bacteroidota bacterium]